MIYSYKINRAVSFAIKTHEVDQKQKRKGKDVAYITHPLTVGLILSQVGANENTIVAGVLHDTIEDSIASNKVTAEILEKGFGKDVASLVLSVTEQNKGLSWEDRKKEALEHIKTFSHDSLLVKSADVMSNTSELLEDYESAGDEVFERFNAPKERILQNCLRLIRAIVERWPENPLASEMTFLAGQLQLIGVFFFMSNNPAPIIEHRNYDANKELECTVCGWRGFGKMNTDSDCCSDVSCPICDKMLLVISYTLYS